MPSRAGAGGFPFDDDGELKPADPGRAALRAVPGVI